MKDFIFPSYITKQLINKACDKYNTHPEAIFNSLHLPNIVKARKMIIKELHKRGYNYNKISKIMKRHHTSILNLCDKLTKNKQRGTHLKGD